MHIQRIHPTRQPRPPQRPRPKPTWLRQLTGRKRKRAVTLATAAR